MPMIMRDLPQTKKPETAEFRLNDLRRETISAVADFRHAHRTTALSKIEQTDAGVTKPADVFSPAILRLYARDRTTLAVFVLLSFAALLSLLFGTGWMFSLSARYSLAAQLVLLGLSLDALRAFYSRALSLLDPATALDLVSRECQHYTRPTKDAVERMACVIAAKG